MFTPLDILLKNIIDYKNKLSNGVNGKWKKLFKNILTQKTKN